MSDKINKAMAYIVLTLVVGYIAYAAISKATRQHPINEWTDDDGTRYTLQYCDCNTPIEERPNCGILSYIKESTIVSTTAGARVTRVNKTDDIIYIAPAQFDCESVQWRLTKIS